MKKTVIQMLCLSLILGLLCSCSSQQAPAENKEMELLRKETELAKKETELAKKELELSRNTDPNLANVTTTEPSPITGAAPEAITETKVLLRFINDARACWIIKGKITLRTQGQTFTAVTGKKGYATFEGVPCGEKAVISVSEFANPYESDQPARQLIKCAKSVYLGTFSNYYGVKVPEKRAEFCYQMNPN
ncbi:MAG: hypothetical protein WBD27_03440 [Pyrinomonadaceae bacterium]